MFPQLLPSPFLCYLGAPACRSEIRIPSGPFRMAAGDPVGQRELGAVLPPSWVVPTDPGWNLCARRTEVPRDEISWSTPD